MAQAAGNSDVQNHHLQKEQETPVGDRKKKKRYYTREKKKCTYNLLICRLNQTLRDRGVPKITVRLEEKETKARAIYSLYHKPHGASRLQGGGQAGNTNVNNPP